MRWLICDWTALSFDRELTLPRRQSKIFECPIDLKSSPPVVL